MASTGVGFRWLDILEKEFDKAYVELDTSLAEIDADDPEVAYAVRQKMAALSSCFAQLSHKAQTIFQNSAKVEAELINLRTELVDARARKDVLEQQYFSRLPPPEQDPEPIGHMSLDMAHLKCESLQLYRENIALRDTVLALHSEVYGARLAAKYLDKELAGRIQQLQLLGREMKGELRDRLWRQLEAEILLQRHKTVVRACRSADGGGATARRVVSVAEQAGVGEARGTASRGVGEPRHVRVPRKHHQGLGISITGGREHGVPILISELETDGPAAHTGQLYVGDAILSVNNIDLRQACHKEAVSILQNQTGDCILCVQFVAEDSDDDNSLSEEGYTFQYPVFPADEGGAGEATPTAPRTPDPPHLHPLNHVHNQQEGLHPRSGSEDYSDYLNTPENNHNISSLHGYAHQTAAQNTYYNNNLNISPIRYEDSTYPVRQSSIFGFNNLYDEYHTANNNKVVQHSILDMDDNTIKIETEINSSIIPYDDKLISQINETILICNDTNANAQEKDGCDFVKKHVEVVDLVNNGNGILNTSNNSFTNSESASSPMQTSSDNIIISSGISCGNIDLNSADSKSPKSLSDETNKTENQKIMSYISNKNEKKISEDKITKTTDLLNNSPVKNVKHKTVRKNAAKMDCDKSILEVKSHKSNIDTYDKESEVNQNLGFLYPKLSNIKPFGLNQYHGLLGDIKKGFDESSLSPEDSVETTPVHGKKPPVKVTKKKRVKGGDWKSKGAYQAINNANTSDMDSPIREIKPDKRYHRDGDTHSKFGVKTIQSIFEKSNKEEKQETKKLMSNLMDEISSEVETNLVLQEQLVSLQKLPVKAESKKNTVEEKPLMRFTPEHALPNLKPNNSVVLAVKSKAGDSLENCDNSTNEQCFNTKLISDSQCANAGFQQNIKAEVDYENGNIEGKNLSVQNIQVNEKKISNTKLNVKNRGFRIGSAKRVPPPPDVIHIPLKDFSKNMQDTAKMNSTDNLNIKVSSDEGSNLNQASSKNYAEAEQIFPESLINQEQIETEINDIYPVIESIIRGTHSSEHSQADIDATLKLALGQLEKSMMNDRYERESQQSNPSTKPQKQNNYCLPPNKSDNDYYSMPNKVKAASGKRSSISSYPLAKDILIEGNGDPDFGTPV